MPIDKEKTNSPHFRDAIPHWYLDRSPSYGRPEFTEKDSHYEGDIARSIIFPNEPPKYDSYNRLFGKLYFNSNSKIWEYSDKQIENALKNKLAKKYNIPKEDIIVRINRNTNTIYYEYIYCLNSKINSVEYVNFKNLEVGDKIILHPKIYEILDTFDNTYGFKKKYQIESNDIWIVREKYQDKFFLILERKPVVGFYYDKTYLQSGYFGDKAILVSRGEKYQKKFKEKVSEAKISFKDLKNGEAFVFYDITDDLKSKGVKWNTFFIKTGDKEATEINNKIKLQVSKETPVILQKRFSRLKYEKEDLDDIFDNLFYKYRKYNSVYGPYILAPFDEFKNIFEKYNVPFSKFQSLTKQVETTAGKKYTGSFISNDNTKYMWMYDENEEEIKITKMN